MPPATEHAQPLIAYRCRSGGYLLAPPDAPVLEDRADGTLTYLGEVVCDKFDDAFWHSLEQQFETQAYACVSREEFFALGATDDQAAS
jgi:hypothetical protein